MLVIYWIAFPIIVTRYLRQMLQSQQKAEEHLRVLRSREEPLPPPLTLDEEPVAASAHARRTDDEMRFQQPVCTSTLAISKNRDAFFFNRYTIP